MTEGFSALTDKEKETLRLLLDGHDAKSIAAHFDLSVHTINERLREARRKLAVSSSRAAARLLREEERKHPELLGDKVLGDATETGGVEQHWPPAGQGSAFRRPGWVIGGLLMSITLGLTLIAASSLGGLAQAPSPQSASAAPNPVEANVIGAARNWLALVDNGDWQASWEATGHSFRKANSVERWADASKSAREPLGGVESRQLATVDFTPAPPSGNWVVKFRTDFANKANVAETVTLIKEDGTWKVIGCMID
ncbi:DUF4019 domain-containing protein [Novosphingobium sp. ZN18A2]|uniref:helix-turn-helix domain-containing protein n=1 Tax=Novosphingobium sp. ZN18A2 TaxID=3079861 RepID=UPI0030CC7582